MCMCIPPGPSTAIPTVVEPTPMMPTGGLRVRRFPAVAVAANCRSKSRLISTRFQNMQSIWACLQKWATQRIRIDCVSEANHDLIRLLDKPGGNWGDLIISKYLFLDGTKWRLLKVEPFFQANGGLACFKLKKSVDLIS